MTQLGPPVCDLLDTPLQNGDQDRGRLIDAFENNDADYLAVADTLKIKHATILVDAKKMTRGGANKGKVDSDTRHELLHALTLFLYKLLY